MPPPHPLLLPFLRGAIHGILCRMIVSVCILIYVHGFLKALPLLHVCVRS